MLSIQTFIEKHLKGAKYEYDAQAKVWCAWVPKLPGVYAQADSVEKVREDLAEVIEEYVIVSLQNDNAKQVLRQIKQSYASA